jgi:HK97 family phage prohead protease
MPYGISQNQPDCSRWAAVVRREDGSFETLACYDTKQDAIDRMVAQSLAEGLQSLGEVGERQIYEMEEPETEEPEMEEPETEEPSDDVEEMLEGLAEQQEYGINPRQGAMYDIYEKIAEEFGKWDQGIGADGAHYVAQSPFADEGMVCANCVFYEGGRGCEIVSGDIAPEGICKLWIIAEKNLSDSTEPQEEVASVERRQISLIAPDFMAASARRGLRLHEEGLSGDGLVPATVADARRMANGEALSEAKWRKIPAWIARHIVDLDAVQGDEITAGLVAMLLWGGGSSKTSARRAQAYAQRIVDQLDAEADRNVSRRNVKWSPSMTELRKSATAADFRWCVKQKDEKRFVAFTNLEARQEGDGNKLIGYASVFDSPSEPMPFTEFVRRGAFAKTLNDGADVRLLIDHEGVPLARTKSGTLMLEEDDRGLRVEATLDPANPDAARVISAMKRGDISQMSFAFRTVKDSWNADRSVRELKEVQLYDVSVVTFPAYEETVAEIRSGQNAQEVATIVSTAPVRLRSAQIALARRHSRD